MSWMTVTRAKFFELKIQEILTPYYIGSNANLFDIKGKEMDKYPPPPPLISAYHLELGTNHPGPLIQKLSK